MAITKVTGRAGSAWSSASEIEAHFARFSGQRDRGNLGVKDAAAGDNIRFHSRLRAKHARQMFGLRADDCGGCFIPMFGNPSAARHRAGPLFI